MSDTETNKKILRDYIQSVWREGDLAALPEFWTAECINHAMPGENNQGLERLHTYHEQFFGAFSAFSGLEIDIVQQVAEADRVVSQIVAHGQHRGEFMGIAATGKAVSLWAIRIDRFQDGKIAEHWSVSDLAGLLQQLQT